MFGFHVSACNILVEGSTPFYSLSNYGSKRNCTLTSMTPSAVTIRAINVGPEHDTVNYDVSKHFHGMTVYDALRFDVSQSCVLCQSIWNVDGILFVLFSLPILYVRSVTVQRITSLWAARKTSTRQTCMCRRVYADTRNRLVRSRLSFVKWQAFDSFRMAIITIKLSSPLEIRMKTISILQR